MIFNVPLHSYLVRAENESVCAFWELGPATPLIIPQIFGAQC